MILFENKESLKNIVRFLKNYWIITEDDKNAHELYSILVYIVSKEKISKSIYPFLLIKNESPDFRFMSSDEKIFLGVEHIIATVQDYKMASNELSQMSIGSKLDLSYYSPFHKLPKDEIFKGILNPEDKYKGQGHNGDRPEAEWVEIIRKSIKDKTKLLNKKSFNKFDQNELLIEDDSPVKGMNDLEGALEKLLLLKDSMFDVDDVIKYDRISILSKKYLIYDVFSQCKIVDKSKESLIKLYAC